MNPSEWLQANATLKDGADVKEFESIVSDLDPLKNIKTKEDALNFIDRNSVFKSGLDSAISRAVSSHDEKFKAEKLPELLKAEKEAYAKELNPDITDDQKKINELTERLNQADKEKANNLLKDELRAKAKELGYSVDISRFVVYGDKALETLEADFTDRQSYINTEVERQVKERFGGNKPPKGGGTLPPPDIDAQIFKARQIGDNATALRLQLLKNNNKTAE